MERQTLKNYEDTKLAFVRQYPNGYWLDCSVNVMYILGIPIIDFDKALINLARSGLVEGITFPVPYPHGKHIWYFVKPVYSLQRAQFQFSGYGM